MIYLIGGAPRVGKSIIATRLAKLLSGRLISIDELEKQSNRPAVVFFSSNPAENTLTPKELVDTLVSEANLLHDDINRILRKAKDRNENVIIEGVHILPEYVMSYAEILNTENVKSIFIGSTNTELVLQGMAQNTGSNNWLKDFGKTVRKQIALFTNAFSNYLISEAQKYKTPYKERSLNFQEDMSNIIKEMTINKVR